MSTDYPIRTYTKEEAKYLLLKNHINFQQDKTYLIGMDFDVVATEDSLFASRPSELIIVEIEQGDTGIMANPGTDPLAFVNMSQIGEVNYDFCSAIHPKKDAAVYISSRVRYSLPENDDPEEGNDLGTSVQWWREDCYPSNFPKFVDRLEWPDKRTETPYDES